MKLVRNWLKINKSIYEKVYKIGKMYYNFICTHKLCKAIKEISLRKEIWFKNCN